ncbi:hypothetical protein TRFO_33207 [Tritrichomonas foetus]|uniref:Uncharacterized protein n=1 Tax=Tritrichomonas foetus TaxID=1144522 RepID=A0A1J4JNA4_9EUKA|nr:hypothetical protein TRFO_33207 [Tritrichomonas foetus]|eukprot:OHT00178.1 hypothetical protein TRFO_33207 [Tritrichomonas foetus]
MKYENEYYKKEKKGLDFMILFDFPRNPVYINLMLGGLFILISSLLFAPGYQIFPSYDYLPSDEMNPECGIISQIGYIINESYLNISYVINSDHPMTLNTAFNLFRIILDGIYYKEELRYMNIDQRFQYNQNYYGISYQLLQEGLTNLSIKCLDKHFYSKEIDVQTLERKSKYSVFHSNNSISNLCFSNNRKLLFLRNNIKFFTSMTHDYLTSFAIVNSSIDEFQMKNPHFQIMNKTVIDASQKTTFDLISKVLPTALVQAQNKNDFILNVDDESNNTDFINYIKSITGKSVQVVNRTLNDYCITENSFPFDNFINYTLFSSFKSKTIRNIEKHRNENGDILFLSNIGSKFINFDEAEELLGEKENVKILNLDNMTLEQKIIAASNAKLIFSLDDGNEVGIAAFMPDNSSLILFKEEDVEYSSAVDFVMSNKIKVIPLIYGKNHQNIPLTQFEKVLTDI